MNDAEAAETVDVVPLPDGVTVKVYEEPFVSPATTQLCEPLNAVADDTEQVKLPGDEVTVYSVATPSARKETVAAPLPAFAVVGAAKAEMIVTLAEGEAVVTSAVVAKVNPLPANVWAVGFLMLAIVMVAAVLAANEQVDGRVMATD